MSMAGAGRAARIAVVQPVIQAIKTLPADKARAVEGAIRAIGVEPGVPVDLPTAPAGYPYRAQRPRLASAPFVIYRESQPDELGDWLVVSLMAPEEFGQQKRDERSGVLRNPDVRREIAIAADTAASTASTGPGAGGIIPDGGAAPTNRRR
jgi:hypothetical protein